MKERMADIISGRLDELFAISRDLYEHPELSEREFRSSQLLADYLAARGFAVEKPYLGVETGFRAVYAGKKPGLRVGLFCEYDALPEIGHGCGHNLICTASIGAALALMPAVDALGGAVVLFGTPAEETNGVKGLYGERGAYGDIDFGMMAHPDGLSASSGSSLAIRPVQYAYFGRCSHAAFRPEEGINALDAVLLLFNGVNALRQHLKPDVRIHGIINSGGLTPNLVPEYACARFYLRAAAREYLDQVEEKVRHIAEGAARMTGARLELSYYEPPYDELVSNPALSAAFDRNLAALTGEPIRPPAVSGSMDMGNVSRLVPAIHPMVGLGDPGLSIHTRQFAQRTVTDSGRRFIRTAASALACTALDVMEDGALYREIQRKFEAG